MSSDWANQMVFSPRSLLIFVLIIPQYKYDFSKYLLEVMITFACQESLLLVITNQKGYNGLHCYSWSYEYGFLIIFNTFVDAKFSGQIPTHVEHLSTTYVGLLLSCISNRVGYNLIFDSPKRQKISYIWLWVRVVGNG